MNSTLRLSAILLSSSFLLSAEAQNYLAVISPDLGAGQIDVLNANDGSALSSIPVLLNGTPFDGFTGIAHDPNGNTVYATVKDGQVIKLAELNLQTFSLTLIATLSVKIASITWGNGVLYGISGDGGTPSEQLYIINTSTGALTNLTSPGVGFDGEAIAMNSTDGLIYRYGGGTVFQSINPSTLAVVNIGLSHNVDVYAHGLAYEVATNSFLFSAGDSLYTLTTGGLLTLRSDIDDTDKGYKGFVSTTITGVNETSAASTFLVYPNPALDRVELNVESAAIENLQIYDTSGALVDTRPIAGAGRMTYDLSALPNGIYSFVLAGGTERLVRSVAVQR